MNPNPVKPKVSGFARGAKNNHMLRSLVSGEADESDIGDVRFFPLQYVPLPSPVWFVCQDWTNKRYCSKIGPSAAHRMGVPSGPTAAYLRALRGPTA